MLIRLIVLRANRSRAEHPGHLSVRACVLAIDCVRSKEGEAAAFSKSANARAADAPALSDRASENEAFCEERLAVLPRIEAQTQRGFGSAVVVRREKSFAVPRAELIFEYTLVDAARCADARASAGNEIVDQRPLNKVLQIIRAHLLLTDRHAKLPEAKLKFIDAMNVYVHVP